MTLPWFQHPDPDVGKSQQLRLIDIYALGPAMIWVGVTGRIPLALRILAVAGGVYTIRYNWVNYERLQQDQKDQQV